MSDVTDKFQMEKHDQSMVLILVRDLMFQSRITGAAKQAGAAFTVIRDPANLGEQPGSLLIVDLNQPDAIEAAAAWKQATAGPVVGFVSHVDADAIERARDAGIDRVLARSAFVQQLPGMFPD